jgi:hypothetical protein
MSFPVQITYRGVDSSEPLNRLIRSEAAKLGKFFDGIVRCRALVERPDGHHHAGPPFHIRLTLAVPGAELVIAGEPSPRVAPLDDEPAPSRKNHEIDADFKDPTSTVKEAFRRARRRLKDYARRNLGSHSR